MPRWRCLRAADLFLLKGGKTMMKSSMFGLVAAVAAGALVTGCVHRVYDPVYTTQPVYTTEPVYAPTTYVAPVTGPSYISTTVIDEVPPPPPPPIIPGPGPAYYGRPYREHYPHHRPPMGGRPPVNVRPGAGGRPQPPAGRPQPTTRPQPPTTRPQQPTRPQPTTRPQQPTRPQPTARPSTWRLLATRCSA